VIALERLITLTFFHVDSTEDALGRVALYRIVVGLPASRQWEHSTLLSGIYL
jgi:hypothetical protein